MTKKRLSDLLRDEVQNSPADESNPPDSEPEVVPTQAPATPRPRRSGTPTKADLEAMLEELKADLETSQAHEAELAEKVTTLQKELDNQKDRVHQLQADLEEAQQYQAKFAHAEETIRQLTTAPLVSNQTTPKTTPEIDYRSQRLILKRLPEHAIDHSVRPRAVAQRLSNDEIGWVD